jgi:hypothetical protein
MRTAETLYGKGFAVNNQSNAVLLRVLKQYINLLEAEKLYS